MASFVHLKCSAVFRLNTGADPDTGKSILKVVSIRGLDPDITAVKMKNSTDLITPLFIHPAISIEKTGYDLLDAA